MVKRRTLGCRHPPFFFLISLIPLWIDRQVAFNHEKVFRLSNLHSPVPSPVFEENVLASPGVSSRPTNGLVFSCAEMGALGYNQRGAQLRRGTDSTSRDPREERQSRRGRVDWACLVSFSSRMLATQSLFDKPHMYIYSLDPCRPTSAV